MFLCSTAIDYSIVIKITSCYSICRATCSQWLAASWHHPPSYIIIINVRINEKGMNKKNGKAHFFAFSFFWHDFFFRFERKIPCTKEIEGDESTIMYCHVVSCSVHKRIVQRHAMKSFFLFLLHFASHGISIPTTLALRVN